MTQCQLCNRKVDERATQEQAGYYLCLSCDCKYTDNELIQIMENSND